MNNQVNQQLADFLLSIESNSNIKGGARFDEFSDKTNTFYRQELYDLSSKGWLILDPMEINS